MPYEQDDQWEAEQGMGMSTPIPDSPGIDPRLVCGPL